jgi:hypothetical protein
MAIFETSEEKIIFSLILFIPIYINSILDVKTSEDSIRPYKINYLVLRPARIYSNGAAWSILLLFS